MNKMPSVKRKQFSRRDFIRLAAGAAAAGPLFLFPSRSLASQKTLKIAKSAHFEPAFDLWRDSTAQAWGRQRDIKVTVDRIRLERARDRAASAIKVGKGHA